MPSQEPKAIQRLSNISGQMTTVTRFNQIPLAPPDAILGTHPLAFLDTELTVRFNRRLQSR
jgi:hypothetical protein